MKTKMEKAYMRTVLLMMSLLTWFTSSAAIKIGGIYYRLDSSTQTAQVTNSRDGEGYASFVMQNGDYSGNIVIPKKVTYEKVTYTVTAVGAYAFYRSRHMTSVRLPESLTEIGAHAFQECTGLTSFDFPESLTYIGFAAFSHCEGLKAIRLPNSLSSLDTHAFASCIKLKTVILPSSLTQIPESMFSQCSDLTYVDFPESLISIDRSAFYGCESLISLVFPSSLISIEDEAFFRCYGLKSLTFPKSLKSIWGKAFYECTGLTSVSFSDGLETFGVSTFERCSNLSSVTFPKSLTSIGSWAFKDCSSLVSVNMDSDDSDVNLTIGHNAFENCISLTEITIPANVVSVGSYVFSGCKSLSKVTIADRNTKLTLGSNGNNPLFSDCPLDEVYIGGDIVYPTMNNNNSCYSPFYNNKSLRSVVISDLATCINYVEFMRCTNLQEVVIGKAVEIIDDNAFWSCSAMKSLTSRNSIPPVCGNDVFVSVDKRKCTLFVPEASIESYKNAPQWKDFFQISSNIPLGINDINGGQFGGFEIETVGGNALRIGGAEGRGVEVYGVDGRCEWRTGSYDGVAVELTPGMYIVRVGGHSVKVML